MVNDNVGKTSFGNVIKSQVRSGINSTFESGLRRIINSPPIDDSRFYQYLYFVKRYQGNKIGNVGIDLN